MTGIKWVHFLPSSQQICVFLFGNEQKPPELTGTDPSTRKLPAQPGRVRVGKAGDYGSGNSVLVRFSKEMELSYSPTAQHDYLNEERRAVPRLGNYRIQ